MVDLIGEEEFTKAINGVKEKSEPKIEKKVEKPKRVEKSKVVKPKRSERRAVKKLEKKIKKARKAEKKVMRKLEKKLKKSVVKSKSKIASKVEPKLEKKVEPKPEKKIEAGVVPIIIPKLDKKIVSGVVSEVKPKFSLGISKMIAKRSEKKEQKKIEKKFKKAEKKLNKELSVKSKVKNKPVVKVGPKVAAKVEKTFAKVDKKTVSEAAVPVARNIRRTSHEKEAGRNKLMIGVGVITGAVFGAGFLLLKKSVIFSISVFFLVAVLFMVSIRVNKSLKKTAEVNKMEKVFPDFLQLVSGNLRAGITIDKAILLSARKEFEPLDAEIMRIGKDITTGRSMEKSLADMSARIDSEKIKKTITLITSDLRAGGNLAILLERTASNMRERSFVEKRAASNVLMYEIFIFVAVAIGAPALFALSTILVQAMTGMMASTPAMDASVANLNVPFSFSGISISMNFIVYYSMAFMITIGALSSLIIGLVSKGDEKAGLKYLIPIVISGLVIFWTIRYFLADFVSGLF